MKIVVVPSPAPAPAPVEPAVCRLCGKLRTSRLCCMAQRGGKTSDPIHPIFEPVELFLRETSVKAFGRENFDLCLELIAACRQEFLAWYAAECKAGNKPDGHEFQRIDADMERLKKQAKGKLFACANALSQRDANKPVRHSLSASDVLKRILANKQPDSL